MQGHRDLKAWNKAMLLVTEIHRVTANLPKEELYGLTSQMRRAAISIPSNLAEGHGRSSSKEFHQFIGHSRGSLMELETQVEIAKNLGFVRSEAATTLLGDWKDADRTA